MVFWTTRNRCRLGFLNPLFINIFCSFFHLDVYDKILIKKEAPAFALLQQNVPIREIAKRLRIIWLRQVAPTRSCSNQNAFDLPCSNGPVRDRKLIGDFEKTDVQALFTPFIREKTGGGISVTTKSDINSQGVRPF